MESRKSLKDLADAFIAYKRSLGYNYDTSARYIYKYIACVEEFNPEINIIEKKFTEEYIKSLSDNPGSLYGTVCTLREFGKYLHNKGFTEVYIVKAKSCKQPVAEPPYFFTEKEIDDFFSAVDKIEPHNSFKGRELVIPVLFRLMYCCGLRCKEVRILKCSDVHIENLYIDILQSKGPKSRRIFISQELADYLKLYNDKINLIFPERIYFFPSKEGYYKEGAISSNFKRFWKKAYPDFVITSRPRAYDFRHHFAWSNLNKWAAEGLDVNVMLAYLMRYMGHSTIKETLYYFHFVPEFFPKFKKMTEPLEDLIPEVYDEE